MRIPKVGDIIELNKKPVLVLSARLDWLDLPFDLPEYTFSGPPKSMVINYLVMEGDNSIVICPQYETCTKACHHGSPHKVVVETCGGEHLFCHRYPTNSSDTSRPGPCRLLKPEEKVLFRLAEEGVKV